MFRTEVTCNASDWLLPVAVNPVATEVPREVNAVAISESVLLAHVELMVVPVTTGLPVE